MGDRWWWGGGDETYLKSVNGDTSEKVMKQTDRQYSKYKLRECTLSMAKVHLYSLYHTWLNLRNSVISQAVVGVGG